jgi:hypothetical protein
LKSVITDEESTITGEESEATDEGSEAKDEGQRAARLNRCRLRPSDLVAGSGPTEPLAVANAPIPDPRSPNSCRILNPDSRILIRPLPPDPYLLAPSSRLTRSPISCAASVS